MAANNLQKVVLLDINAATFATIQQKLLEGFVIQQIINLQPAQTKLLVVYSTPEEI